MRIGPYVDSRSAHYSAYLLAAAGILLACLVGLLACANPSAHSPKSSSGSSSLSVSILPQASRAIVAGSTDYFGAIKAYKVTVSDTSNSYTSTTVSAGICTIDGIAVAADYAVAVQAYSDTGYATQIASGSASSVIVTAGATTTVPITLSFTQTAASGGYSLKVAWPASMALPYVCAKLDSSAATYTAVQGTSDGTNYTATISASSLSGGAHQLYIYFAATSSSTPLFGPYMESLDIWDGVTDSMWADPSGALHDTLTLTADEFASSNADLAGLSVTNAALSPSFSTGTTSYSLSNFSANAFTFSATLVSGAQNISYKWNSAAGTWTSVVGSAFTSPSLGLVSGSNSLQITVTAPDRQTSTTYTIALSCGAISVGLGVDTSYLGLAFPSSTTIVQGQAFGAETGNPSLDAITSGWTWYLDGVAQGESSQRFVLSPSSTSSMIGNYLVAASVKSGEVTYSGRIVLAVTRKASLSMSPTNANVTTLAGSWTNVGSADGTGAGASFSFPEGITTDGTNLYVADSNNNEIRRIVIATGVVTTLAGSTTSGHADGTGAGASFSFPEGITTDGTNLYVVDGDNNEIRKVVIATGAVTTLAGSWTSGFGNADGTGAAASFSFPQGITTDGTNLYVADFQNNEIRKIVIATAVVTTLAGSGASGHADGTGTAATFNLPHGIATDGTNLYVADCYNNEIRKIVIASRVVTTLAGSYTTAGHADGTGTGASFMFPYDITTDGTNLYVTDQSNNEIRKIVIASKVVTTLAGSTTAGHADDTGTAASFNGPYGITTDGTKLYVADNGNNEIREIQQ